MIIFDRESPNVSPLVKRVEHWMSHCTALEGTDLGMEIDDLEQKRNMRIQQLEQERDKYKAENEKFKSLSIIQLAEELNKTLRDRDIWKKACELVCDAPGADPYFLKESSYWYEQAKKMMEEE